MADHLRKVSVRVGTYFACWWTQREALSDIRYVGRKSTSTEEDPGEDLDLLENWRRGTPVEHRRGDNELERTREESRQEIGMLVIMCANLLPTSSPQSRTGLRFLLWSLGQICYETCPA